MTNQQAINRAIAHRDSTAAEIRENVSVSCLKQLALGDFDPNKVDWHLIKPLISCMAQIIYSDWVINNLEITEAVLNKGDRNGIC